MRKQKKASRDPENPVWTKAMFSRARPAREVEPDLVSNPPRIGRPPVDKPKQQISLRLDPDVIAAYRSTGAGWQKLMQSALSKAAPRRRSKPTFKELLLTDVARGDLELPPRRRLRRA